MIDYYQRINQTESAGIVIVWIIGEFGREKTDKKLLLIYQGEY